MFKLAIPVLHVSSSAMAEDLYCTRLGFSQEFAYRPYGGQDPWRRLTRGRTGARGVGSNPSPRSLQAKDSFQGFLYPYSSPIRFYCFPLNLVA